MRYKISDYIAALDRLVHAYNDDTDNYIAIKLACDEAIKLLPNYVPVDPEIYRDHLKMLRKNFTEKALRNGI